MREIAGAVLMVTGAAFVLIAALGVIRMPDVLMRMHATTKAGTLGTGLTALSVIFFYSDLAVSSRALAIILFVLLTAPVAAHMISRAAYMARVKLWEHTFVDQYRSYSERATQERGTRGGPTPGGEA